MRAHLSKAKILFATFKEVQVHLIGCSQNTHVDPLAKLASTKDAKMLNVILVENLAKPSALVEVEE